MNKIKKVMSLILLLCLFLCTSQLTVYAANYVLSGTGYKSSHFSLYNNLNTFYAYWDSSKNAWNNASSKVSISTLSSSNFDYKIEEFPLSDSYYGLNIVGDINIWVEVNSNKCTSSNVQSVIVHELGHVLNLADNNDLLLYPVPIMSNYRDRTLVKTPSQIDIDGVNASYNSYGIKY